MRLWTLMAVACLVQCLVAGCSMMPANKVSTAEQRAASSASSQHETTLRQVTSGLATTPANVTVSVSGTNNTVSEDVPAAVRPATELEIEDSGGVEGSRTTWASYFSKTAIPWGISLMLVACGILLLLFALKKAKQAAQSTAAGAALWQTADAALANMAERVGTKMAASQTAERNAELAADMSVIEKQRRKLGEAAE